MRLEVQQCKVHKLQSERPSCHRGRARHGRRLARGGQAQTPRAGTRGACGERGHRQEAVRQRRLLSVPWIRGQGGAAGPRLAPRPLPYAGFSRYVRRPTNQMPPYTEKLVPDTDLAHIYAYLQSRPAPPPVSGIPLLQ